MLKLMVLLRDLKAIALSTAIIFYAMAKADVKLANWYYIDQRPSVQIINVLDLY